MGRMCIVVYSCACLGAKAWIKSISSGAQYATLRKYFSHLSLVMYSFATPTKKKLKLGQEQIGGGGTTNSKPPGRIIMMGPIRNTLSSSQIIFITLFSAGAQLCCALYQPRQPVKCMLVRQNQFPQSNRHMLDVVHPMLLWRITY